VLRGREMKQTLRAAFDGEALRPLEATELETNGVYRITIGERLPPDEAVPAGGVLARIAALAQDLDLPEDFAAQHDHYLYGTPKR
jgi:hypothetical protein